MQEQQVITADMAIGEVVAKYPSTVHVFFNYGLGCVGCAVAQFENIQQGAQVHGIDVDALIKDLNNSILETQKN